MRRVPRIAFPLALLSALACSRGETKEPIDLVVLSVETLRADHLGAAGYAAARTPNLDRLIASGTYFEQATTPMPRTTPALASLLTGLWPHHHGSREVGDPMLRGTTLAEILRAAGYTTQAVVANLSASGKQGFDRGFDRFVSYTDLVERYAGRLYREDTDVPATGTGWATAVSDEALALVRAAPADRPLLLWTFYFDPHFLYRPPSPWQDGVEAARCFELYRWALEDRARRGGRVFNDIEGAASAAVDDCRRLYDAEIAYVDAEVKRLLDGVAAARPGRTPLVLFTADHGENLGEGGLFFEHGENLAEAGMRVPLAWSGPGVAEGRRDAGAASLVDALTTTLGLLGLGERAPREIDGVDLGPVVRERGRARTAEDRRVVFAESANALWNQAFGHLLTGRTGGRVCANDARFALCEETGSKPGVFTLHDHRADPDLARDLAARYPADVERLREVRAHWPPESARSRVARTGRFKLLAEPLADGTYRYSLFDLAGAGEAEDVAARFPAELAELKRRLEAWAAGIGRESRPERDRELEEELRGLGYLG
jgi:arylsulfatase A-like enzyme